MSFSPMLACLMQWQWHPARGTTPPPLLGYRSSPWQIKGRTRTVRTPPSSPAVTSEIAYRAGARTKLISVQFLLATAVGERASDLLMAKRNITVSIQISPLHCAEYRDRSRP